MKMRGIVTSVSDPKNLGRLKARLVGFGATGSAGQRDETPWAWPCVPFADAGSGVFWLPPVGAEVWIEQAAEGDFVWTGCFWSGRKAVPGDAQAPDVRVLTTPAGHQLKMDEAGDLELKHANGNTITLTQAGNIEITISGDAQVTVGGTAKIDASQIHLNGSAGQVITTKSICKFDGTPHALGSQTVKAGGG